MRFANIRSEQDEKLARTETIQKAFNSPFRPFILATTSIGQEGLDFHPYCHRVYHWNLPSNPVDLEQCEGRIHRYKGHAIRKNVALRHGFAVLRDSYQSGADPWQALFDAAAHQRKPDQNDLVRTGSTQCPAVLVLSGGFRCCLSAVNGSVCRI